MSYQRNFELMAVLIADIGSVLVYERETGKEPCPTCARPFPPRVKAELSDSTLFAMVNRLRTSISVSLGGFNARIIEDEVVKAVNNMTNSGDQTSDTRALAQTLADVFFPPTSENTPKTV